jgi:RimJ/RimL family protein N-acetyltransferase
MEIYLRPAEENDAHLLFQWRSEPEAARNSLNSNPIEWIEHKAWFDTSLSNKDRIILIGMFGEEYPFGTLRFDHLVDGADVSINIDPNLRGRGLGKSLLKEGIKRYPDTRMFATIRGSNVASLIIFLASGFELVEYNPATGLTYLKREPK